MALLDESANGVFIIAATPFSDNGALDLESVDRMVDFYLERGANGLTILGVMGEAPKLTDEESRAFISRAIARARGGRHGRPARPFAHRRPDLQLFRQRRRNAGRNTVRVAGLSARHAGADFAQSDPPHRRGAAQLRDAQA